jgi:hypothetical protein
MASSRLSLTTGGTHGKTSTSRHGTGCAGAGAGHRGHDFGRTALRTGGAAACNAGRYAGGHSCSARGRTSYRGQATGALATKTDRAERVAPELGWATSSLNKCRRRARVLGALGKALRGGWHAGCFAAARRSGPKARSSRGGLSGVSDAGAPRLAQGSPRHPTPQKRPIGAGAMEKNSPKRWQRC